MAFCWSKKNCKSKSSSSDGDVEAAVRYLHNTVAPLERQLAELHIPNRSNRVVPESASASASPTRASREAAHTKRMNAMKASNAAMIKNVQKTVASLQTARAAAASRSRAGAGAGAGRGRSRKKK